MMIKMLVSVIKFSLREDLHLVYSFAVLNFFIFRGRMQFINIQCMNCKQYYHIITRIYALC